MYFAPSDIFQGIVSKLDIQYHDNTVLYLSEMCILDTVVHEIFMFSGSINFLHADCEKFRHPLLHIQKTPADCPVIAIDSFRHMYVFPDFKDLK